MGDDVVQLRLSLNEETVKQVQNRIQNIVNKLNNGRVNITVNTGNLDNALKQLNTLKERINRINNTQIKVSCHCRNHSKKYDTTYNGPYTGIFLCNFFYLIHFWMPPFYG